MIMIWLTLLHELAPPLHHSFRRLWSKITGSTVMKVYLYYMVQGEAEQSSIVFCAIIAMVYLSKISLYIKLLLFLRLSWAITTRYRPRMMSIYHPAIRG